MDAPHRKVCAGTGGWAGDRAGVACRWHLKVGGVVDARYSLVSVGTDGGGLSALQVADGADPSVAAGADSGRPSTAVAVDRWYP